MKCDKIVFISQKNTQTGHKKQLMVISDICYTLKAKKDKNRLCTSESGCLSVI